MLTMLIFILGNKKQLVPTGAQNFAEMSVEFVEDQIVLPTIGPDGLKWTPYLLSLFFFIFFCNIFEIIPLIQMPATARIALPMFLALLSYVLYHGAGFIEHGPVGYLKHALVPPGVPVGAAAPRGPDRVHLEVPRPAVQPHGATLRQPAGRPHPARHLRRAHLGPAGQRSGTPSSSRCRLSASSSSPPSRCWSRSCRPTCSPCWPASTSVPPSATSTDPGPHPPISPRQFSS